MRRGRVAALAGDDNLETIRRRHGGTLADGELADRNARLVMHAIDLRNAEFLHHAVVQHGERACPALFRRLEDDRDGAFEIAGLGQILRRPQKHGRVPVMAAGMGLAGRLRGPGLAAGLKNRQRVHVGAETDGRTIPVPPLDDADHAGLADAGLDDIAAEGLQFFGHEFRCFEDIIEQFRVLMQMASPAGNVFLHFSHTVQYRHSLYSLFCSPPGCRKTYCVWNFSFCKCEIC
ncbi:hypothetical protein D3C86_971860 [compost metagenome]